MLAHQQHAGRGRCDRPRVGRSAPYQRAWRFTILGFSSTNLRPITVSEGGLIPKIPTQTPNKNLRKIMVFSQATTLIQDCENPLTPTAICAIPITGKICGGDSGGPAVADLDRDGRWVQYGIHSFAGSPCGSGRDGYEEVSQWTDTILEKITYQTP